MTPSSPGFDESPNVGFLLQMGHRIASAEPLDLILLDMVECLANLVHCSSCSIYMVEGNELRLRASKYALTDSVESWKIHAHERVSGWKTGQCGIVSIACHASSDARFKMFYNAPEEMHEAFLSVPILGDGCTVGVINLHYQQPHHHTKLEIRLLSTIGFFIGFELKLCRMEKELTEIKQKLDTRALLETAKGIIGRRFNVDEQTAYFMLQKGSRQKRKSVREVAEAIILSDTLRLEYNSH
jgi:uroporphyrinogen-III synthase